MSYRDATYHAGLLLRYLPAIEEDSALWPADRSIFRHFRRY